MLQSKTKEFKTPKPYTRPTSIELTSTFQNPGSKAHPNPEIKKAQLTESGEVRQRQWSERNRSVHNRVFRVNRAGELKHKAANNLATGSLRMGRLNRSVHRCTTAEGSSEKQR